MLLAAVAVFSTLLILFAAVGLWAWRGKRVDDHPLCRKCGFDLTGKPEDSTRCAECGADLQSHKALRKGHRVVRTRWVITSAAVAVVSAGLLGTVVLLIVWNVNLQPHKACALLRWEVLHRPDAASAAACQELMRRVINGKTPAGNLSVLIEPLLHRQADTRRPWCAAHGDLLFLLHDSGSMDVLQWQRFAQNMVEFRPPSTRDRIALGENVSVLFSTHLRGGSPAAVAPLFVSVTTTIRGNEPGLRPVEFSDASAASVLLLGFDNYHTHPWKRPPDGGFRLTVSHRAMVCEPGPGVRLARNVVAELSHEYPVTIQIDPILPPAVGQRGDP